MKRAIGSFLVVFILGGLFLAFRDARSLMARPGTRASSIADDGLTTPPNWKVEPAEHPPTAGRTQSRLATASGNPTTRPTTFGATSANSSPPLWTRRDGKVAAPASTYLPRNPSAESPTASFSTPAPLEAAPKTAAGQTLVGIPGRAGSAKETVADEAHLDLLHHAKFLIKAGLAPIAKEPLQQIIRDVPGTPIAREARLTLDSIRN
jgi:hypothetical protein